MRHHKEQHHTTRIGWLRAAVLGANDGIVSVSSLVVGVAAAHTPPREVLLAGLAGLIAGAFSMAAGEYVSVSSQADTERADLERERRELAADPKGEHEELAGIYVARGVTPPVARVVADQLMAHDALEAHARDELGLSQALAARPLQAAGASALSFAVGAAVPVLAAIVATSQVVAAVAGVSMACLVGLGAIAARIGGASAVKGAARVTFWGALAMAATAAVGAWFGVNG
ncbi:MAG TPA: VIT family protein [Vicinamibacterales bacterium]|jgi:VIT1/CCC1 family predicted Fe2+/Mn2+ transporter|nr:VIT family protein [Vicinamibacterales bacterium]